MLENRNRETLCFSICWSYCTGPISPPASKFLPKAYRPKDASLSFRNYSGLRISGPLLQTKPRSFLRCNLTAQISLDVEISVSETLNSVDLPSSSHCDYKIDHLKFCISWLEPRLLLTTFPSPFPCFMSTKVEINNSSSFASGNQVHQNRNFSQFFLLSSSMSISDKCCSSDIHALFSLVQLLSHTRLLQVCRTDLLPCLVYSIDCTVTRTCN